MQNKICRAMGPSACETTGNAFVHFVLFPDRSVHETVALVLAVASDGRAAASAAAAAARHACCVCVSFFVIHNAGASSTDIDPHASGRSPQTARICSGAYVATHVSTEQE